LFEILPEQFLVLETLSDGVIYLAWAFSKLEAFKEHFWFIVKLVASRRETENKFVQEWQDGFENIDKLGSPRRSNEVEISPNFKLFSQQLQGEAEL